jgi:hypothetical protein
LNHKFFGGIDYNIVKPPTIKETKVEIKEPELFEYDGVTYTKDGKTFATLMTEDVFSKMNALQDSNRETAMELDRYQTNENEQILNVPREFSIDVMTGLGTKTPLALWHTIKAGKVSLDLQWKLLNEGNLSAEEYEVLPRIQAEARSGLYETLTEPAKLYAFNKIVSVGIPALGKLGGNTITKTIGAKAANKLFVSSADRIAMGQANKYLVGQLGKQVATKLTTVGLIGSGATAGVEITTDETGGTSFGFNVPRAIGGVATMGGFVIASSAITSIGAKGWDLTMGRVGTKGDLNRLANPFQKSALVDIEEGQARLLTGQNTGKEITQGRLVAKGEANALIAAQKQARANFILFDRAAFQAPITQKYGLQYRAAAAKAKVIDLQAKISKYVRQPETTSRISTTAKELVGNEYKWGTRTTVTTSKPNEMGKMTSSTKSTFKPLKEGGTRTFEFGKLVLSYDTAKFMGFEYPTSKPYGFINNWKTAPKPTSTSAIKPIEAKVQASGVTVENSIPIGGGQAQTTKVSLPQKINLSVPRMISITQTNVKTIPTQKVESKTLAKYATKTNVEQKVSTKTNVLFKPFAKYSMNYGIIEKVATKTNVEQKVSTKEKVSERTATREAVRERIAERVAVKTLVRERIQTKVMLKQRLVLRIPTRPKLLPPSQKLNFKSNKKSKLALKLGGSRKKDRFAYADLLNVNQSQFLYGKGTSPNKARPQTQKAIRRYGYRLQTAEQLKHGKNKRNNYISDMKKGFGGLKL